MNTTSAVRSRVARIAGGVGLLVGGGFWILGASHVRAPLNFSDSGPSATAAIIVLAGMILLAMGVGKNSGVVGRSATGKIALILFGLRNLVLWAFTQIVVDHGAMSAAIIIGNSLSVFFAVVGLVAAIQVTRARVVSRVASTVFLIVAIVYAAASAMSVVPVIGIAIFLSTIHAAEVLAVALLIIGAIFLIEGCILPDRQLYSRKSLKSR
ncbi:hypothetical protein OSC27_13785 [Microbacterium sp. STN6]|uniref:hypothetical protein n=1 Tax=Microbacterium sp. STN6 TaxID=2995588 RepID=UPI002260A449|nr:hypothetical protein [Microbacterium sp. STN6]MCX7523344.1 hypothetical protein [Microbacterium sp. STN6]